MRGWKFFYGFVIVLLLMLVSCVPPSGEAQPSLVDQAAQEATHIVQEAQATALIAQAQAKATQIANQSNVEEEPSRPVATVLTQVQETGQETPQVNLAEPDETEAGVNQQVEIVGVGFAADGGFIIVQFRAPAEVAETWWQGDILVLDEATEMEYKEVPVMPKIGPLISKPQLTGQVGYAMLVNTPPGLKAGALVTVVLGDYRFEHIPVQ